MSLLSNAQQCIGALALHVAKSIFYCTSCLNWHHDGQEPGLVEVEVLIAGKLKMSFADECVSETYIALIYSRESDGVCRENGIV